MSLLLYGLEVKRKHNSGCLVEDRLSINEDEMPDAPWVLKKLNDSTIPCAKHGSKATVEECSLTHFFT